MALKGRTQRCVFHPYLPSQLKNTEGAKILETIPSFSKTKPLIFIVEHSDYAQRPSMMMKCFKNNSNHQATGFLFPVIFHLDQIDDPVYDTVFPVGSRLLAANLPVYAQYMQIACGSHSHRMCPRDRSLPCGLQPPSSGYWHRVGHSG